MALTNNHITYTAEDLLRYARGQMTPQQMHALERATMEDPFLAEALDGYMEAVSSMNVEKDSNIVGEKLEDFKKKIGVEEKKKEPTRIIPLWRQKWLQYAVAASVLLAGGWWVLSLNKTTVKEDNVVIAQNETTVSKAPDSIIVTKPTENQVVINNADENQSGYKVLPEKDTVVKKEKPIAAPGLAVIEPPIKAPVEADLAKEELKNLDQTTAASKAKQNNSSAPPQVFKDQTNKDVTTGRGAVSQNNMAETTNDAFAKNNNAGNFANNRRFTFNGKIMDAYNNPLPFSNVTIPGEGVGTYSDAKGNFNFVYVDSVLPVRARSLGYEEKTYTMQPDVKENRIVLQEDENLKREIVINRQEKQARNQAFKPMIVETDSLKSVEPSIGWNNYNLYALNNSRAVELPVKRSVELSFDISKTGEAENITVDKSSGKELDEEAIRLLKEGPKWKKKKGTKSRGKVILKF